MFAGYQSTLDHAMAENREKDDDEPTNSIFSFRTSVSIMARGWRIGRMIDGSSTSLFSWRSSVSINRWRHIELIFSFQRSICVGWR